MKMNCEDSEKQHIRDEIKRKEQENRRKLN